MRTPKILYNTENPGLICFHSNKVIYTSYSYDNKQGIFEIENDLDYIPDGGFFHEFNLKELILPEQIKSIGKDAFTDCNCLEAITTFSNKLEIPYGIYHIKNIRLYVRPCYVDEYKKTEWNKCKGIFPVITKYD